MNKLIWLAISASFLISCAVPNFEATEEQREADLNWIFATFDRNYAPLDWKKTKLGVDMAQVKADCYAKNKNVRTNDEFRALVNECVSKFQDAHTRVSIMGSMLPGKAKLYHLGFSTVLTRYEVPTTTVSTSSEGTNEEDCPPEDTTTQAAETGNSNTPKVFKEALLVSALLPSNGSENYLIQKDDLIIAVNGMDIKDYLNTEIVPYMNLGHENTSLSVAALNFPVRSGLKQQLPKQDPIVLSVQRAGQTFDVELTWTEEDHVEFNERQEKALEEQKKKTEVAEVNNEDKVKIHKNYIAFADYFLGIQDIQALVKKMLNDNPFLLDRLGTLLETGFKVVDFNPDLKLFQNFAAVEKAQDRDLGKHTLSIDNKVFDARIKTTEKGNIAYIRIPSFSIGDDEVKEFGDIIHQINSMNTIGVVVDLIDNGGGSLVHGLRMLNMLTDKNVKYPGLELKLNDNWYDSIISAEINGSDASRRSGARKIRKNMDEARSNGKRNSSVVSSSVLAPYRLLQNKLGCLSKKGFDACLNSNLKVVVLVNEMCASMCDIFATSFKNNGIGQVFGSQSMGAGGNVTNHAFSPVAKIMLRQTESLVVDINGNYIENQGVVPHLPMDTVADRRHKFKNIFKKTFEQF